MDQMQQQIDALESKLLDFQNRFDNHDHDGTDTNSVNSFNLFGTDPWYDFSTAAIPTTGNTQTTLDRITLPNDGGFLIESRIVANRTGGSAGTAGDSAGYIRRGVYQRINGAAPVLVGSVQDGLTSESQAGWDATLDINGNDVRVRVTGATNNNVSWKSISMIYVSFNT